MKAIHIDDLPLGGWFRYAERGPESEVFVLLDRFGPQSVAEVNPTNARMQAVYSFGNRDNFVLPVQMTEVKDPVGESIPPSPGGPLESALKDARWRIANLLQGQTPQQTDIDMLNRLDFLVNSGHAMSADDRMAEAARKAVSRETGWRVNFAKDEGKLTVLSPDGAAVVLHMDSYYKGTADTLEKFANGFAGLADARFNNVDEFVTWLGRLYDLDAEGTHDKPWPPAETAAEAIQARHMDGVVPGWMHGLVHSFLAMRMQQLLDVQGQDGTWNADPYMLGMYNGMELMLSMVEGRDPSFREMSTRGAPATDELAEFDLHSTADAKIWADAFCKINRASDHGTMHTWFANAIMTGWDHALKQTAPEAPAAQQAGASIQCNGAPYALAISPHAIGMLSRTLSDEEVTALEVNPWAAQQAGAAKPKMYGTIGHTRIPGMSPIGDVFTSAATTASASDDELIIEAVKQNNVYGVLPNSASTVSIGRAVLVAERNRAALAQQGAYHAPVAAWMTEDGQRVVAAHTMNGARRDGGAMLSSMKPYSVALIRASHALRTPEQPETDGATQVREHGPENKESANRREDGGTGTDEEGQG